MEPNDWGLTAEDLDFLEQDAIQKLSQRNSSSSAAADANPQLSFHPVPSRSRTSGWEASTGANKAGAIPPSSGRNVHVEFSQNDKAVEMPKLSVKLFPHASGAIGAKFAYHSLLVGAFRRIPKASWHASERLWMFPLSSLSVAEEVLSGINGVNIEVQSLNNLAQRALHAASSLPNLQGLYVKMPSLLESRLLPFQRDGVRFILQHGGRALLADEMGLGKTLQAIAAAACIQDQWPVLVLTPSSLRLHWASMIQQWLDIPASDILVVLSQYCGSNKLGFKVVYSSGNPMIHLDGVFNILSYDVVPKLHDLLLASEFKIVIADESHFLKNAQAKRTSSCLPILQKAHYAILLSGTPALSRPIELFKQLEALYPGVYRNVHEYGKRYCKGGLFGLYQGASNQEELHNLMKATVMIRRLKKDVLSELPVKRRQQVFLNLNEKSTRDIKIFFHELEVLKGSIATCGSSEKAESLEMSRKNIISKLYTSSAAAKIPAVLEYLSTVVEAGCKFLIFAHHQAMIDSIHEYLKKKVGCIRIDGGIPSSSRQALVNDFQEREDIRAAVLSIKAGGIGLTLSAASTVIFAELSWNPGDLCQAEDRAHRIGQVSSVNVYYLLASDTIDDMIWEVVQSKLENLGQVLDGQDGTLEVCTGGSMPNPAKQGTLDAFLRRCDHNFEEQPKLKVPKKQTM